MLVHQDRRAFRREPLALRLQVQGKGVVVTRNISPAGLYVVLPAGMSVPAFGPLVLTLFHRGLRYQARAQIVRVDANAFTTGVALRLRSARVTPHAH